MSGKTRDVWSVFANCQHTYTADKTSFDYRKHKIVHQKLKLAQNNVLATIRVAYILHNSTRYGVVNLDLDIENSVLKV